MRLLRPLVALPVLVVLLACGDGGTGSVPGPGGSTVASVSIGNVPTTITVGQSAQLTATALDASHAPVANPGTFVWSSGAISVATVDQTGKITGVSPGSTTISASVAGIVATASIPVTPSPAAKDTVFTIQETFVPNQVTITPGSSVVFAFGGGIPHNVIFDRSAAGAPADIQIAKDVANTRTFGSRGSFKFDCTVHPGMSGEILVR
jgi:plastocyanin